MSKTSVGTISYSDKAPKSYVVNAGAIYKNLTYSTSKGWEGELLGATAGGNKVTISIETRPIEVDGVYTDAVGQKVLTKATAMLEANVKEITPDTLKLAILGETEKGDGTTNGPLTSTIIKGKSKIETADYLTNIALVGELTGSNEPIIIILDNALCTSGLDMSTKDGEESVIKLVFQAHANAKQLQDRTLPCRIIYPEVA